MGKKKHKFDLSGLVAHGWLKDGQTLCFVSDPSKKCQVSKQPNGEFKVTCGPKAEVKTVHAFAQECLGTEPPDHASKWIRCCDGPNNGKSLYDLWQMDEAREEAA